MGYSSFDNLAANGIIDFDAEAYIKGTKPRYVGNPESCNQLPFEQPLPGNPCGYGIQPGKQLEGEPEVDAFIHREKHKSKEAGEHNESEHSSPWKPFVAGGLITALGLYIANKYRSVIPKITSNNNTPQATTNTTQPKKGLWNKIKSFFKGGTPQAAQTTQTTQTAAPVAAKKGFFSKKWVKVTGWSSVALLGLYGIYRFIQNRKYAHEREGHMEPFAPMDIPHLESPPQVEPLHEEK